MKTFLILTCVFQAFLLIPCTAQDSLSFRISDKSIAQVNRKAQQTERRLVHISAKMLSQWKRHERRMLTLLAKSDSVSASNLFTASLDSLDNLEVLVKSNHNATARGSKYNSYLDTIATALSFLKNKEGLPVNALPSTATIDAAMQKVNGLTGKMADCEKVRAFVQERKKQLIEQLGDRAAFGNDIKALKEQAFYYNEEVKGIKEALKDKKRAEAKAMELIKKIPAFNDFMKKHGQIASLFNISGDPGSGENLEGLQTRNQVEQLIQQRIGSGPNAGAVVSQQMADARNKFDEFKNKFPDLDNAAEMPDFKPNEMKTKRFVQRLEFGSNVQFQRSNRFFPTTGDLAGQVAYKFHKNGSTGIGLSYKLGMGTGFENIHFSGQGMGIRSFIDWKLKGTFFLNGGYEQNYQPNYSGVPDGMGQRWTQSGLIGLSKKYKINSKLKGNMMVLFDFLYHQHFPTTDPIKVRLGYNF